MSTATADPFALPEAPPAPPAAPEAPAAPAAVAPVGDEKPKRPTTRAGRRAAAEAKAAKKATSPRESKPSKPTPRKASLETRLAANIAGLGTVVAATGGMVSPAFVADGVLVVEHSANVAKALAKVADDQPQVKAALERALTAGVWSGLIAAVLPLAVGIAANHGAIPSHLATMLADDSPQAPAPSGVV